MLSINILLGKRVYGILKSCPNFYITNAMLDISPPLSFLLSSKFFQSEGVAETKAFHVPRISRA